ncbi:Histidine kinase, dimerization and phosphoacceptor region [metagenome]|uniref:histidine kinase n=1 Tax=metagenome TaxID=256318 RepID=A0A2P2C8C4_9ZZZZ
MRRPSWLLDAAVGGVVAGFGIWEAMTRAPWWEDTPTIGFLVGLGMAVAAGLFRLRPGLAVILVWLSCGLQVISGIDLMIVELAALLVSYGAARHGSRLTLWVSGLSIPVGSIIALLWVQNYGDTWFSSFGIRLLGVELAYGRPTTTVLVGGLLVLLTLSVPWLVGLTYRIRQQAQASAIAQATAEEGRSQAEEIARLREEQATLARDVHDVVGHSLAVILAQAESAQFLKDGDNAGLKQTMANIAVSARTSLQDVRQVLAPSPHPGSTRVTGGLDSLIEGVRSSGHEVSSSQVGTPQPLPPELEVVAYRVLQEMLTNAIRHGRRGEPVGVERHWQGELRIEVRNVVDESQEETRPMAARHPSDVAEVPPGQGLDGMRRRLESVGGRLDVRRREESPGATFTTTAWVPLRAAG